MMGGGEQSSGCFGCCTKPTLIIAVDEPTKGLRIRGRRVRKPSISDDFWSSSTYELENSALQSQRSLSSISASNPTLSQCSSSSGIVNPSDFVNQGKFCLLYNIYISKSTEYMSQGLIIEI
ncbi:Interleukin-4 receptor subunit alpha [Gossypium australe]|uniref:Interleukin-4 receptor subunit alpha n=1 Tax=Gossypium australe TaxID=47621 RepID=A0A5B6X984_9ROSI|nr:Interleukin-4 receptor subunit alpha [Gossypium australe]